jgi:hypothetical protein
MAVTRDSTGKIQPAPLHLTYTVEALQALTDVLGMGLNASDAIDLESPAGKWHGEAGILLMRMVALDVIAEANKRRDDFRAVQARLKGVPPGRNVDGAVGVKS